MRTLPALPRYSLLLLSALLACENSIAAEAPEVVVEQARTADIVRQIPLTGTITADKAARLSTEVSGRVQSIEVDIGERVAAGDALLRLDNEISKWDYQASQALTAQLRAELVDAQRRYTDAQRLRKQNSISENEIQLREAEVNIRAAALKRQQAEEQKQRATHARHTLNAPFAGVISRKLAEVGEWVEPGTAVLELVALDILYADFAVPQDFYPLIDEHSRITLSDAQIEARIGAVVPVNDPAARTFRLRALLDGPPPAITPGMSVNAHLQVSSRRSGVVISRDAVLRYPDGRVTVWVVNQRNGTATVDEVPVKTGHAFDGMLEIRAGIEAGRTVVVEGNEALRAGQQVRIVERARSGVN